MEPLYLKVSGSKGGVSINVEVTLPFEAIGAGTDDAAINRSEIAKFTKDLIDKAFQEQTPSGSTRTTAPSDSLVEAAATTNGASTTAATATPVNDMSEGQDSQIVVKLVAPWSTVLEVRVCRSRSILELKEKYVHLTGCTSLFTAQAYLGGQALYDNWTLEAYGIQDGDEVCFGNA